MTVSAPAAPAQPHPSPPAPGLAHRGTAALLPIAAAGVLATLATHTLHPSYDYGIAADWRVFCAAAQVTAHGGSPYTFAALSAAEQSIRFNPGALAPALVSFVDLPVVAVITRPLLWLPFWSSFLLFEALSLALAALALRRWADHIGWPRPGLWILGALLAVPTVVGLQVGQFDLIMLAAAVATLLAMEAGRPWVAGVCAAAVLLKPHILWPLPLLVAAVWASDRHQLSRFAAAFAATTGIGLGVGFLLVPGAAGFFHTLSGFAATIDTAQPDLAGLPGLFAPLPWAPLANDALSLAGAGLVVLLALAAVRRGRRSPLAAETRRWLPLAGLAVWLAATAYVHTDDLILLYPLLALVILRNPGALARDVLTPCLALTGAVMLATWASWPAAAGLLLLVGLLLLRGWDTLRAARPEEVATALAVSTTLIIPLPILLLQTSLPSSYLIPISITAAAWLTYRNPAVKPLTPALARTAS